MNYLLHSVGYAVTSVVNQLICKSCTPQVRFSEGSEDMVLMTQNWVRSLPVCHPLNACRCLFAILISHNTCILAILMVPACLPSSCCLLAILVLPACLQSSWCLLAIFVLPACHPRTACSHDVCGIKAGGDWL